MDQADSFERIVPEHLRRLLALVVCAAALCAAGCDAHYQDLGASDPGTGGPSFNPCANIHAEQTLAAGTFVGNDGYEGTGAVTLSCSAAGVGELVLGADFVVSPVPAPVVVLTDRKSIGTQLAATDHVLGVVNASSGSARFEVGDAGDRRYVFIYCKPLAVEIAFAALHP